MRKKRSWAILFLSLLLVLTGLVGLSVSAIPKNKKLAPPSSTSAAKPKEKTPDASKASPAPARKNVYVIKIDAPITPVVAEYIVRSIDTATVENAETLIIQLDTPGGLVESMRDIVKKILVADVPIVVYVAPAGARAASAGVFITMAANIAAMAPSTHLGAAHPVTMTGKMDKTMETKIVNDLAAMIRGIAEKRGRNAKWAEEAVRKSASITETEALKENVIDLIALDMPSLLKQINGKSVDSMMGKKTLHTEGAAVQEIQMGFRYRLLEVVGNPNVAAILFILGVLGLIFELSNPGAILPGVAGAICIILAFYAFQALPINYAGLLLIILGIGLFIAEAFITSHGILGVGGVVSMVLGLLMLINSPSPFLQISWAVIAPIAIVSAVLIILIVTVAIRSQREKPDTGREGLIGMQGEAKTDILADGQIFVRGEYWSARSDEPIQKGQRVTIDAVEGLKLKVRKSG